MQSELALPRAQMSLPDLAAGVGQSQSTGSSGSGSNGQLSGVGAGGSVGTSGHFPLHPHSVLLHGYSCHFQQTALRILKEVDAASGSSVSANAINASGSNHSGSDAQLNTAGVVQLPKMKPLVVTPEQVIKLYPYKLSEYEAHEIFNYPQIYFIGANAKKRLGFIGSPHNNGYDDDLGSYLHVTHDHIAYRCVTRLYFTHLSTRFDESDRGVTCSSSSFALLASPALSQRSSAPALSQSALQGLPFAGALGQHSPQLAGLLANLVAITK
jgi:hypothetical protein